MSNSTPLPIEQILETEAPVLETTKQPGKLKTALRHPIHTVKRHKIAVATLAGVALGSVATYLLTAKLDSDAGISLDASASTEDDSND